MNSKFKYQEVAVKKLSKLKAGCLFMQMGTGKTKVAVDLANLKNDYDYIVWIAPASLLKTVSYIKEIDKWQPLKPVRFWSIESLGSSDYKYCDLTLENVTVDCSDVSDSYNNSICRGSLTVKGETNFIASSSNAIILSIVSIFR